MSWAPDKKINFPALWKLQSERWRCWASRFCAEAAPDTYAPLSSCVLIWWRENEQTFCYLVTDQLRKARAIIMIHLSLITTPRPHFQASSPWGPGIQYTNWEGENTQNADQDFIKGPGIFKMLTQLLGRKNHRRLRKAFSSQLRPSYFP